MIRICDIGEAALTARIQKLLRRPHHGLLVGPGDDAAVLGALKPTAVASTDMLVEDVDFKRAWAGPEDIGHKAAAVNLSDLAAMGARPRALLVALALQPKESVAFVLTLLKAVDAMGRRYGAPLVGGDMSKTAGPLVVSVTALGEAPKRRALPRFGARTGDVVMVSGALGGAAYALRGLLEGLRVPLGLRRQQLRPEPQVALGLALGACRDVHACADISDGLCKDAMHLPGAGLGVHLDTASVPMPRALHKLERAEALQLALGGGEDFELVFAVAARAVPRVRLLAQHAGCSITAVGRIVAKRGLWLDGKRPRTPAEGARGFDHFII